MCWRRRVRAWLLARTARYRWPAMACAQRGPARALLGAGRRCMTERGHASAVGRLAPPALPALQATARVRTPMTCERAGGGKFAVCRWCIRLQPAAFSMVRWQRAACRLWLMPVTHAAGGCAARRDASPGAPQPTPTSLQPTAERPAPCCWPPAATRAWARCRRARCSTCSGWRRTRCRHGDRARSRKQALLAGRQRPAGAGASSGDGRRRALPTASGRQCTGCTCSTSAMLSRTALVLV